MSSEQNLVYRLKEAGTDGVRASLEPIPKPGRGEYLVRIHAISLNYRDYKIANQSFFVQVKFERIPMSDGMHLNHSCMRERREGKERGRERKGGEERGRGKRRFINKFKK
jgi:hypothetical protein